MNRYIKCALTKFRLGISCLACHRFRYKVVNQEDLLCRLCSSDKENELHFLLCCPALHDLRFKLIPKKYYADPCLFRFCLLMSSRNEDVVSNLALYVYEALKRLEVAIS